MALASGRWRGRVVGGRGGAGAAAGRRRGPGSIQRHEPRAVAAASFATACCLVAACSHHSSRALCGPPPPSPQATLTPSIRRRLAGTPSPFAEQRRKRHTAPAPVGRPLASPVKTGLVRLSLLWVVCIWFQGAWNAAAAGHVRGAIHGEPLPLGRHAHSLTPRRRPHQRSISRSTQIPISDWTESIASLSWV